jgi:hypothetical protein
MKFLGKQYVVEYKVERHSLILNVDKLDWKGSFELMDGISQGQCALRWTQTFKKIGEEYHPLYEALNKSMQVS